MKIFKLVYIVISCLNLVYFCWIISIVCSIKEGDNEGFVAMGLAYIGLLILINIGFSLMLLIIDLFALLEARQKREPIRFIVVATVVSSLPTLTYFFLLPLIGRFVPIFNLCFRA